MTHWYEYAGMAFVYTVIAFFALFILWMLYGKFERTCYDKPKPENVDTLFRNKRCDNCRHSEVSTDYPKLACPVQGRHMEPGEKCEAWA